MGKQLASLFNLWGSIGQSRYLTWGVFLFVVKFLIDWLVATYAFGRDWSPLRYVIWPDTGTLRVFELNQADRWFGITMLALALPFIAVGVILTLQRMRDAGLSRLLIVLFFVPLVNLLFILWLCLVPSGKPVPVLRSVPPAEALAQTGNTGLFWIACIFSSALSAMLVFVSANLLKSYGFGLFVLLPFANGWLAAIIYGLPQARTWKQCLGVGLTSLALSAFVLIIFALEGLICLIMLAPLAAALCMLGATVGYAFQWRHWVESQTPAMILAMVLLIPALMAAESHTLPEPLLHTTQTEVIIHAPPEVVWKHVVAFSPLPEPTEWFFRLGVAYPKHAQILGTGVGAVRHCVFSTGEFVEPITVWDAPHLLAFDVLEQPCTMQELSPFRIHPPHLDQFLVSRRGEFRLEALPDGSTRLVGTTWYTNKMWPESYWSLWSNYLIGSIHQRVLQHMKGCAEGSLRAHTGPGSLMVFLRDQAP